MASFKTVWMGLELNVDYDWIGNPEEIRGSGDFVNIRRMDVYVGKRRIVNRDLDNIYFPVDVSDSFYWCAEDLCVKHNNGDAVYSSQYLRGEGGGVYRLERLSDWLYEQCVNDVYGNKVN